MAVLYTLSEIVGTGKKLMVIVTHIERQKTIILPCML